MRETNLDRKLAAILSADVVGYSRLMGDDEQATLATLTQYRSVMREHIKSRRGRVIDTPGDALLAEFQSPVQAVEAGVAIQRDLVRRNAQLPEHRRMFIRIGINLGDVIQQEGALYGDGVNIAARLEALCEPGGICVSGTIFDQVDRKVPVSFDFAGEKTVKNIEKPVRVYHVSDEMAQRKATPASQGSGKKMARAALFPFLVLGAAVVIWFAMRAPGPANEAVLQTARMVTSTGEVTTDPVLAMPTGPSIAVLPFDNLSNDPEQEYFVFGLTEQLISGLARFQNVQVIARNSSAKYKGQAVDVREVGRDLGANYVLEGSVRKDSGVVRVTAQLIDTSSGAHLWAETYERDLTANSIFAIQDGITAQVASIIADQSGVIARKLTGATAGRRTNDLAAFECVLLAYKYDRLLSKETYLAARSCLEKTVERDPNYPEALSALSYVYGDGYQMGLAEENSSIDFLSEAYRLASRAVELDPTNAGAQRQLAIAYFYIGELDGFHEHAERAFALNPHDPTTLGQLGTFIGFTGDYARAGSLVRKAFALNADLPAWYKFTFAGEHYAHGEWEAGRALMESLDSIDDNPHAQSWHLLFLGELGLKDRATEVLSRLRSISPNVAVAELRNDWAKWNIPSETLDKYVASWRKAGVPESAPVN